MVETILVVDDEEAVRELLAEMLRDAGYAVAEARHGAEALERLSEQPVQLVVSDISMPVMDGYGLYQSVRARSDWASLPFIFLTGHDERPRLRHAKELGVDDYLVKPVVSEDLLVAVRALLARHARLEAARDDQIDRLRQAILVAVSHELRTPLTYLSGYAELLAGSPEAPRVRNLVDGILKGARRLQRLAEDLVFLVELRSGRAYRRFEAEKRPVEHLPLLLREALAARQDQAAAAGVTLAAEVPAELPVLVGDRRLLGDAVDRLLDNAVKFSKREGGRVSLRARAEGSSVVIEVEDEGVGIPAAELARVSELFHQVDRQRNEQQGVGSGLTVAHSIALLHRGELQAESEPGRGSRFTLRLPVEG